MYPLEKVLLVNAKLLTVVLAIHPRHLVYALEDHSQKHSDSQQKQLTLQRLIAEHVSSRAGVKGFSSVLKTRVKIVYHNIDRNQRRPLL